MKELMNMSPSKGALFLLVKLMAVILVNSEDVSIFGFCHNNKYVLFTTKACPGGVRLLKHPIKPVNSDGSKPCVCPRGDFIGTGLGEGEIDPHASFMTGKLAKGNGAACYVPSVPKGSKGGEIWTIIPQTENILSDHSLAYMNRQKNPEDLERWADLWENNKKCTIPPTCSGLGNLFATEPLPAPPTTTTPSPETSTGVPQPDDELDLIKESQDIMEYRMRITTQNARIKRSVDFPKALDLIGLSQRIFQKLTSKILSPKLIQMAFRLFEYMYYDKYRNGTLNDRDFRGIKYALEKCEGLVKPLNGSGFGCRKSNSGTNYTEPNESKTISEDRLFNPAKNDQIVELMWKAIDSAHMSCFSYFAFNPSLHHTYGVEMLKFFTLEDLKTRWFRTISKPQRKAYSVILPGLNEGVLKTVDKINNAILDQQSVYNNLLRKPTKFEGSGSGGCPKDRLIWDGSACCLDYNEMDGLIPELSSF